MVQLMDTLYVTGAGLVMSFINNNQRIKRIHARISKYSSLEEVKDISETKICEASRC